MRKSFYLVHLNYFKIGRLDIWGIIGTPTHLNSFGIQLNYFDILKCLAPTRHFSHSKVNLLFLSTMKERKLRQLNKVLGV